MLNSSLPFIYSTIAIALIFDFINGFHDAANSIATIVSTRVMKPQHAVIWAAFFNFIAFLFFGVHVASTIGKGVVVQSVVDPIVICAGLVGAIFWDVITWYWGIPSSSSHALIGGFAGAAVAKGGIKAIQIEGFTKIAVSIVLSPLFGFVLAAILMLIVSLLFFRSTPRKVDRWGRRMQFVSAGLYSLGHGGNDAQKTMGIVAVLLFVSGMSGPQFNVPFWLVIACHVAMGLGTLFGGWRIVRTMGMKITKLKPIGGCCAETAGAATLFLATGLGIPVSTTHTITGSIFGVGSVTSMSGVRWSVAERIVAAWVVTIPASAFVAGLMWWVLDTFN